MLHCYTFEMNTATLTISLALGYIMPWTTSCLGRLVVVVDVDCVAGADCPGDPISESTHTHTHTFSLSLSHRSKLGDVAWLSFLFSRSFFLSSSSVPAATQCDDPEPCAKCRFGENTKAHTHTPAQTHKLRRSRALRKVRDEMQSTLHHTEKNTRRRTCGHMRTAACAHTVAAPSSSLRPSQRFPTFRAARPASLPS